MEMSGPPFDMCNSEFEHSTLFLILILAIFTWLFLFYFPCVNLFILLSCFDLFRTTSRKNCGVFDKLSVYRFEIFSTVTPKIDATFFQMSLIMETVVVKTMMTCYSSFIALTSGPGRC